MRSEARRLPKLRGNLVPMVTPMFEDGGIDLAGFQNLAEMFLDSPSVDGLFVIGLTGEYMHILPEERKTIIQTLGTFSRKDKVISVNIGGLTTEETVTLAEVMRENHLDLAAIVTPTHVEDSPEAIISYFREIDSVGIPFMVYWPPVIQTHRCTTELIDSLMAIPGFVGLKDSSRDMEIFASICARFGEELSVFQGVEMLHLPSLACGSAGVIGGGLNVYPRLIVDITEAFNRHDLDHAIALQEQVSQQWAILKQNGRFRWYTKRVLKDRGIIEGDYCRLGEKESLDKNVLAEMENMFAL